MHRERVLIRIALLHVALVGVLALGLGIAGLPVRGALLGGGAMAMSLATLWGIARSVIGTQRRGAVAALGTLKVTMYLGLAAAVLTGRLVADGAGFAAGVACFLLASVVIALTPAMNRG